MSGRVTSVQIHSLSHVWFCNPMDWNTQASLSISKSPSLLKLIKSVISSNHPLLCRPFSSCLQSFPESGSFQMSQFFILAGQNIGFSASASVLPRKIQDWLPLGWTGLNCWWPKRFTRVFSNKTVQKHQFFCAELSL